MANASRLRLFKRLILVYGLLCVIATLFFSERIYYKELIGNSSTYFHNRDYTMGLFFPKWQRFYEANYTQFREDTTPRWYQIARIDLIGLDKDWQKAKAKEYVRKYIWDAAGIDHRKVEKWLYDTIDAVDAKVYTFDQIFNEAEESHWVRDMYEAELRQAVSFIPLGSHYYVLKGCINMILIIFPILAGIPLLASQLIAWLIDLAKRRKLRGLFLLNELWIRRCARISLVIGGLYLLSVTKNEYQQAVRIKYEAGKRMAFESGILFGILAFLLAFLGFWASRVLFQLLREETNTWKLSLPFKQSK